MLREKLGLRDLLIVVGRVILKIGVDLLELMIEIKELERKKADRELQNAWQWLILL